MQADYKNTYTSEILYHFVGREEPINHEQNYCTLLKVLSSGRISYRPYENLDGWGEVAVRFDWSKSLFNQDLIVPTVTCFADIPFEALGIHTKKYGQFGIGFEKQYVLFYGARPVMYIPYSPSDRFHPSPYGRHLVEDVEQTFRSFVEAQEKICAGRSIPETRYLGAPAQSAEHAVSQMHSMFGKDFLAFVKAFDCTLPDDHLENYYMEREWRKYQYLRFGPDQVRKVVVAPGFGARAKNDFPGYAHLVVEYQESTLEE